MNAWTKTTWVVLSLAGAFVACGQSFQAAGGAGGGGGTASTTTTTSVTTTTHTTTTTGTVATSGSAAATTGGGACADRGDVCTKCESSACSDVYCECANDTNCLAISKCLVKCTPQPPNSACEEGCETTAFKNGISKDFFLEDCAAQRCATACPNAQLGSVCTRCLFSDCESQMNTCLSNAPCAELLRCVGACSSTDKACPTNCATTHLAAYQAQAAQAVEACETSKCSASCQ